MNFRDLSCNVMAGRQGVVQGHAVAAVAANSPLVATEAVDRIEVEYEAPPYVIDLTLFEGGLISRPESPQRRVDAATKGLQLPALRPSASCSRKDPGRTRVDLRACLQAWCRRYAPQLYSPNTRASTCL